MLYLVHRVPYPPNRGDRIRSFRLLEFLAARAEVYLAFLSEGPPLPETMRTLGTICTRVAAAPLGRRARWLRAAWTLATGHTATEGLFHSQTLRRVIRSWTQQIRFDAVVVFCSSMVQYLNDPGLTDVPAIVDLVDVDSQKWLDYAGQSRGMKRLLYRLEGCRLRRLECALPKLAKAITLVSRSEADLYRQFCPADCIHTVANGVDLDHFCPVESPTSETSQQCVFVGALDYRANVDGIRWFAEHVWPEILRRLPHATFVLVGSNPSAAARQMAELPGVRLAGEVPDVRPYLADAALAVIPLRVARGIQNKVLEALAMGKAVVATPQALEGLGVEPDVHVCQASSPEQWIEATTRLLGDSELRNQLGQQGREYVEEHHRWETQLKPFASLPGLPAMDEHRPSFLAPERITGAVSSRDNA
ncbi:MAG: hypothetical protein A2V70_06085 [Planctomycetes bacterium RBG_13_63_9]|nr:MAG: hypothetical protein A2V70_06085 [Planctomycetes bacterium RBG_13_63_9]